jgi:tetratricopeptide (TPR) repeat protein
MEISKRFYKILCICLLLTVAILSVYWQVMGFDFINFDDPKYVVENNVIRQGFTLDGIRWAFSTNYAGNWHPLTWISYMLDIEMFGVNPGLHHLTNLLFHVINSVLLFLVFERMTGAILRSAIVAALFALHPLHVESVVWIAERKDVLSTFLWMLTMLGYIWYVKCRSLPRYLVVSLLYILGLMSKPMLVTLPFVLLLLDYWPLNRMTQATPEKSSSGHEKDMEKYGEQNSRVSVLFLEKIPLILFSIIACCFTIYAQKSWKAVGSLEKLPIDIRIINGVDSYVVYLVKMFCPINLAIFYPYPHKFLHLVVMICALLLLLVTLLVLLIAKKLPYLTVGWFWYLGTLVPVIGFVQVGSQSMADRYTYIPLIGIFLMMVWGVESLSRCLRNGKVIFRTASVVVIISLMVFTRVQVGYWKNSETLFKHALQVTTDNYMAHNSLGLVFFNKDDLDGAIREFQEALQIRPNFASYNGLGVCFTLKNEMERAVEYYSKGLQFEPSNIDIHMNLGILLTSIGRIDEAIRHFHEILIMYPDDIRAHFNLGKALIQAGNVQGAITQFKEVLHIDPTQVEARNYLEKAMNSMGRTEELIAGLNKLIIVKPKNPALHTQLGDLFRQQGDYDKAVSQYQEAISIQPKFIQAMNGLMRVYSNRQEYTKALDMLQGMKQIQPGNPEIYYNIACIYARQNMSDKSIEWLKQSIDKGFHDWELIKRDPDLASIRNTAFINELIKNH